MLLQLLLDEHKDRLRGDVEKVIEQIFVAVADANNLGPFDLVLQLSSDGSRSIGKVLTRKKQALYSFDAGEKIEGLFNMQLKAIPELAKKAVLKRMGDATVNDQISKALEAGAIFIRYDKSYELKYYRKVNEGMKLIDIDDFFNNISL